MTFSTHKFLLIRRRHCPSFSLTTENILLETWIKVLYVKNSRWRKEGTLLYNIVKTLLRLRNMEEHKFNAWSSVTFKFEIHSLFTTCLLASKFALIYSSFKTEDSPASAIIRVEEESAPSSLVFTFTVHPVTNHWTNLWSIVLSLGVMGNMQNGSACVHQKP